ncbi:MAG: TspO/MBR family protein [candidate division WOR-3 bacterium]
MKRYQIRPWRIIISLVIPLFVGFLGSQFTARTVKSWYPTLNKPPFSPPNWVFAPVWNLLFILMGIAFYLVWQKDFGGKIRSLLTIYFLQLFFNLLWSFFFFTLKNPLLAFCEIIILWFLILINIIAFFKVRKVAGYLLIPYLLWVSFALVLNFYLYLLN